MEIKKIIIYKKDEFRDWLKQNHLKEERVGIICHRKHTGKSCPSHRELMEEAICFGWIDTILKKLDENTYIRYFVRRKESGRWSDNTLSYAKELVKKNKMSEFGLNMYKLGLSKPTHDYGIPKNPDMPKELKEELEKDKKVKEKFDKFSPSMKKMIYRQILSGKMLETRIRRAKKIIERLENN